MKTKGALIIFAKPPVPGKVKTRLIPGVGRRYAAFLYQDMLTKTLNTARKAGFDDIYIFVSGNIKHSYFSSLKKRHHVKLFQQVGKDLGQRMFNAFNKLLSRYSYAILIGSDCPALLASDLRLAVNKLEDNVDVIIGPADDGGYYLIGMQKNNSRIFTGINWSSETVFENTYSNIKALNWDIELLPKRRDVDSTEDLLPYFKLIRQESVLYY